MAENNIFRDAFEERRCLVPSDGFYEGRGERGSKQPYRVYLEENDPFAMAGIWNRFESGDETLETVAILTTEPNTVMEPIHDRMPVVLERDEEDTWLHGEPDEALDVCVPYEADDMEAYEISTAVNNPGKEGSELIDAT